jgi:hypothetical protein
MLGKICGKIPKQQALACDAPTDFIAIKGPGSDASISSLNFLENTPILWIIIAITAAVAPVPMIVKKTKPNTNSGIALRKLNMNLIIYILRLDVFTFLAAKKLSGKAINAENIVPRNAIFNVVIACNNENLIFSVSGGNH